MYLGIHCQVKLSLEAATLAQKNSTLGLYDNSAGTFFTRNLFNILIYDHFWQFPSVIYINASLLQCHQGKQDH